MVLMFTDVQGSVDLKNRIGTAGYAEALAKHDGIFRRLVATSPGAEILSDTGDGFFAAFASASDAVRAALLFQQFVAREAQPLKVRCGLHVGEVTELDDAQAHRPKVVGLAADFASRLTGLAGGGQILLTRFPFNEARQFIRSHPAVGDEAVPEIRWVAHGEYLFKGSEEPMEVFEVGAAGFAPLAPPPDSADVRRALRPGDELTLGWRPAGGLEMRTRPHWIIKEKLGEGGFGEVWLAEHEKTRMRRVFKFCFDSQRLRALKREVVLFRLLKDALGDRRDIAGVTDYQFEEPPYFIEYEYVPGGALPHWAERRGGIERVPREHRVRIVAQVAEALAAAHGVGVLHKDIKPSNVLIASRADPSGTASDYVDVYPVLTDFGIGILTDRTQLAKRDITEFGFTQSAMTANDSSRTGTRLYAPPESLMDRPHTVHGDVYALGVLLYQMTVGDLYRPLAEGWERQVDDELLREDIAACVEGDPARRLSSAAELARRLNSLAQRRIERQAAERAKQVTVRRQRVTRVLGALLVVALLGSAALTWSLVERTRRVEAEQVARAEAERARDRVQREVEKKNAMLQFFGLILSGTDANQANRKDVKVVDILDAAGPRIETAFKDKPEIEAPLRFALGSSYLGLGLFAKAEPQLVRSMEIYDRTTGDSAEAAKAINSLGAIYQNLGDYAKAEAVWKRTLEMRRKVLGPDHPETGDTLWNLAIIAYFTNERDKAVDYLNQALAVREKALGPDSAPVGAVLQLLGMIQMDRGQIGEAQRLMTRSLQIREKTLGPNHVAVGEVLTSLGMLCLRTRDFAQAAHYHERALAIFESVLPANHPHIGMTLSAMASIYKELGRFEEALPLAKRSIEITESQLGKDNENTMLSVDALGMVYEGLERYAEAEAEYRRAVETLNRTLGKEHPTTVNVTVNLAHALLYLDRPDDAEKLLKESRDVAERIKHVNALPGIDGLMVEVAVRRKQFEQAEKMAIDYMDRMRRLEPVEMRDGMVRNAAQVFTDLYDAWGKPELAEKYRLMAKLPATQPATQPATRPGN